MSESRAVSPLPRVAMIGVGSMGGAILAGLRGSDARVDEPIMVTTGSSASANAYGRLSGVLAHSNEFDPDANRVVAREADIVILAVKPWLVHDVLSLIAEDLRPGAIVVSVAAGVTTESMEALLPEHVAVVRAMPNTPANVGLGVTGIAGGASATDEDIEAVCAIFSTVGEVLVVREDQINAVTAVSGSGPAYLFLYTEQMTAAARRLGFDEHQAALLARQTVIGAAELLRVSGEDPAELRRRVTSPKGTTEQAILVLQNADLGDLFDRALAANLRRSEELETGR